MIRIADPIAFKLVKIYWHVRPKLFNGVKVILHTKSSVILVRHSYGSKRWNLPGGKIKKSEKARDAIRREVYEEMKINPKKFTYHGRVTHKTRYYRDFVQVFSAKIRKDISLINLGAEIDRAQWFRKDSLPLNRMSTITKKAIGMWKDT